MLLADEFIVNLYNSNGRARFFHQVVLRLLGCYIRVISVISETLCTFICYICRHLYFDNVYMPIKNLNLKIQETDGIRGDSDQSGRG